MTDVKILASIFFISSIAACAQKSTTSPNGNGNSESTGQAVTGEILKTVQTKAGPVTVERLATFSDPWGMTFLPDNRLLLTQKSGELLIYSPGKANQTISGVPAIAYGGQGGLMDVEIDPDFKRNSNVYLYYVEAGENRTKGGALAKAKLENNTLTGLQVIWRQIPKTSGSGHYGGRLAFAPDGKLFITSGDRQKFDPAQDTSMNLGKMIRINSDGSIPNDNPFVNRKGGLPDTWSSGHRNPLGVALHPETNKVWISEMGPKGGDEVNVPEAGKNYGWPIVSNGDHYDGRPIPRHSTRPEFVAPAFSWNPAISPSSLIFYTGNVFKGWKGNGFIGGLSGQSLLRIITDGDRVVDTERIRLGERIRDVIQAPDGSIWLFTDGSKGELWRLTPGK
jgi:aldose sugar dehydrogenase